MNRHFLAILALSAVACGIDAEQHQLAADTLPVPQLITLTVAPVLTPGGQLDAIITGAPANAELLLIRSTGIVGPGGCPPPLGGECLDITPGSSGYIVQARLQADPTGRATFSPTLPSTLPAGAPVALQVVHRPTATGSNPIQRLVTLPITCIDDALEDNDTPTTATVRPVTPLDAQACDNDDDYFRFVVPDGSYIIADVLFNHDDDGDIDAEFIDTTGLTLSQGLSYTDDEYVAWLNTTGADAQLVLNVVQYQDADTTAADGTAYTLDITIDVPTICVDDLLEDDDDSTTATPMIPNAPIDLQACAGDVDWLSFSLAAGEGANIDIDIDANDGEALLTVYDNALNVLSTVIADGTSASLSVSAIAAADYFVTVTQLSDDVANDGVSATVTLTGFVPAFCPVDIYEDNNELATAPPAPLGLTTGLGMCVADGLDWYAVDLLAGESVTATMFFDNDDGDSDLFIMNSQPPTSIWIDFFSTSLANSISLSNDESVTYIAPVTGTYYVVGYLYVDGNDTTLNGAIYDLEIEITPVP
jgi:hypothetical protein